jgi:hypothetical protein
MNKYISDTMLKADFSSAWNQTLNDLFLDTLILLYSKSLKYIIHPSNVYLKIKLFLRKELILRSKSTVDIHISTLINLMFNKTFQSPHSLHLGCRHILIIHSLVIIKTEAMRNLDYYIRFIQLNTSDQQQSIRKKYWRNSLSLIN